VYIRRSSANRRTRDSLCGIGNLAPSPPGSAKARGNRRRVRRTRKAGWPFGDRLHPQAGSGDGRTGRAFVNAGDGLYRLCHLDCPRPRRPFVAARTGSRATNGRRSPVRRPARLVSGLRSTTRVNATGGSFLRRCTCIGLGPTTGRPSTVRRSRSHERQHRRTEVPFRALDRSPTAYCRQPHTAPYSGIRAGQTWYSSNQKKSRRHSRRG